MKFIWYQGKASLEPVVEAQPKNELNRWWINLNLSLPIAAEYDLSYFYVLYLKHL